VSFPEEVAHAADAIIDRVHDGDDDDDDVEEDDDDDDDDDDDEEDDDVVVAAIGVSMQSPKL
jgi:hypothetical protein